MQDELSYFWESSNFLSLQAAFIELVKVARSPFVTDQRPRSPIDGWADVRPQTGEFERQTRGRELGVDALEHFQIRTTDAILSRFFGGGDVVQGNAYLLSDGTGSGKTTVLLDTAVQVNNETDLPSLIVVKDDQSIHQVMAKAAKMGIDLQDRKISCCRYDQLAERLKHSKPGELGFVACDEAHLLSSSANEQARNALKDFSGLQLYATATAAGSLDNILLFEQLIHKKGALETAGKLGVTQEMETGKPTGAYVVADAEAFIEHLQSLEHAMAAEGSMTKLEFPLWGSISSHVVSTDFASEEINFPKAQLAIAKQLQ